MAEVVYRDGSSGPPFPLRGTLMNDARSAAERSLPERRLSFSLLSIRHTEMDVEVDGAWLRNTVVSRVRPAGDTDRIVYDISLAQLRTLLEDGPVTVSIYQTGLETAVVGFYRAVLAVFREPAYNSGALAIVPMFFTAGADADQSPRFLEGTPWQV